MESSTSNTDHDVLENGTSEPGSASKVS